MSRPESLDQIKEQTPKRLHQGKQRRVQHAAHVHVHDAMTILTGKAHVQLLAEACCTQGGAATALRRRDMARQNLACPHILPCQRTFHPIANISGQAFIIEVLKLTARSEEHTSELQSLMRISYAVLCLKKKKTQ